MSATRISPELEARYAQELEAAWLGVKVLRLEVAGVADEPWLEAGDVAVRVQLSLAGPEPVLVAAGLLSAEDVDSIPPCGVCDRGAWRVTRRKSRTRLDGCGDYVDLLAPILVPALVWRPAAA